jgi:HEAT repeat protein
MKYSRLLFHGVAATLICCVSRAQTNALEDRPYRPSASVIKGTVAALSDSSDEVAVLAVRALADWRQAAVADAVAKLLEPGTAEGVRLEAFQFFARLGPQAKPHVAEVLKHIGDPSPNIRVAVLAVILQAEASAENADKIRALLDDSRGDVRAAAAKCLGQAGKAAESHRKPLLTAISAGGGPEFKAEALRALTRIGGLTVADIDAITPLIRDRDAEVRIAAWAAILSSLVEANKAGAIPKEKDKSVRDALVAQFDAEPVEIKAAIIEDAGKDKGLWRHP